MVTLSPVFHLLTVCAAVIKTRGGCAMCKTKCAVEVTEPPRTMSGARTGAKIVNVAGVGVTVPDADNTPAASS